MALESLLASLKNGVSGVARVQPSSRAALRRYPTKFAGVAGVAESAADALPDTPDTPRNRLGYQRKPAPIGACTLDTPDTPQKIKAETETRKVGAGDTAAASRWWLIHYTDREPLEVSCCPEATHAEILAAHPDAIAAEPADNESKRFRLAAADAGLKLAPCGAPAAPLAADEKATIRAWLALIEETDPATVAEVLAQCQRDADTQAYFLARARLELPRPGLFPDDRRACTECRHFRGEVCRIAEPGGIVDAVRGYRPAEPGRPRRCAGFGGLA